MARLILLFLTISVIAVNCFTINNQNNTSSLKNQKNIDETSDDISSNDFQDIILDSTKSNTSRKRRNVSKQQHMRKGGNHVHKQRAHKNKQGHASAKKAKKLVDRHMKKVMKFIRKAGKRRFKPKKIQANYNEFRKQFQKKAFKDPKEAEKREKIYHKRRLLIEKLHQDYIDGKVSFLAGATRFADWDHDDFVTRKNGLKLSDLGTRSAPVRPKIPKDAQLPKEIDWRKKTYISPVEEQGDNCKSCWAFAAGSTLETYIYEKYKTYANLSRQNYVDCAKEDGCDGGHMAFAYNYTIENKGVNSAFSYPYEGILGRCRFQKEETVYGGQIVGYERLPPGDEDALKEYVAYYGPVAVGVDAAPETWQVYTNDLLYDETCTDNINHAVIVIGYGTNEEGEDYWLIKNSWGSEWGDNGYVKLARNRDNHCGVASDAVYPIIQ